MLKIVGNRLLVTPDEFKSDLIEIPDTASAQEHLRAIDGTLDKVGPEAWKKLGDGERWANRGDRVIFDLYGGIAVKYRKKLKRIMNDIDIVGVRRNGDIFPCGLRVLVRIEKVQEKTKGNIFIPATTVDRWEIQSTEGVIVRVGPYAWNRKQYMSSWAKVGDRVFFTKYGGFRYEDGDIQYRFLADRDILGVMTGDTSIQVRS